MGKLQAGSGVSNRDFRRQPLFAQGHQADHGLDGARGAQQMSDAGFGGTDRQGRGALARPLADGDRFRTVIEDGARAVRIDIINVSGRDPGRCTGLFHDRQRRVTLRLRLGEMMLVNGRAVADEFSQNGGAAPARAFQRFQRDHGRAFTQCQTIAPGIERTADGGRERLQGVET